MKKIAIITLTILLLYSNNTKAQITLDTTVITANPSWGEWLGTTFKIVQISSTESKYFVMDTVNNTFSLYNMDFTPFLTNIAVPQPFITHKYIDFEVLYISRTLFDCDSSNIEYAYYDPSGFSTFYIKRTDGTLLFKRDSVTAPYGYGLPFGGSDHLKPIVNTSSGAKLFLIHYYTTDTSQHANFPSKTEIYSLCGNLSTEMIDFSSEQPTFIQLFPNPTSMSVTFQINPPDNLKEYELVVLDENAKVIRRENVGFGNYRHTIDMSNYSSGTYIYSLCTKEKTYQSGKFILNK